jgi:hypothetical protein
MAWLVLPESQVPQEQMEQMEQMVMMVHQVPLAQQDPQDLLLG